MFFKKYQTPLDILLFIFLNMEAHFSLIGNIAIENVNIVF